jgi:hypothetical protein
VRGAASLCGRPRGHVARVIVTSRTNAQRRFHIRLDIPIIPELRRTIDADSMGDLMFLVNGNRRAFMNAGFSQMAEVSVDGSIHSLCMDWRHLREMLDAGERVYSQLKNLIFRTKHTAARHLFPEQAQARRTIWNGVDHKGRRTIDQVLPSAVRRRTSAQEMLIETVNGSIWQMAGSDNYNSRVSLNPLGVVFSEWSLAHPASRD